MTTTDRTDFAGINALSSRPAGYSVALKCLEVQTAAETANPALRTPTRVLLDDDAWSWFQGAIGEIEVGKILSRLGPEWFVRHSVPIGSGTKDIDHLVIGPAGVFAINTKHHAGANIWVVDYMLGINNSKSHHLADGKRDGADVADRLSKKVQFPVAVRPVVALVHPQSVNDKRAADNRPVAVFDARALVKWLKAQPRQLSDSELALITLAAEEPTTWHVDPHASDTVRVMPRFERLRADVGAPVAPATSAPRPRVRPQRPRTPAARARRVPGSPDRGHSTSEKVSAGDIVKLWLVVAVVVGCFVGFRSIANQPCTTPMGCMLPPLYLGVKPLLLVVGIGAIAAGAIRTLVWLIIRR